MRTEREVAIFLKEFKEKMNIWEILFRDDRGKNTQALIDLEIRPIDRRAILKKLAPTDYSAGPIEEKLNDGADMWIFGKIVKKREVYIKITMGFPGASVLCISFHLAEHSMNYPLK